MLAKGCQTVGAQNGTLIHHTASPQALEPLRRHPYPPLRPTSNGGKTWAPLGGKFRPPRGARKQGQQDGDETFRQSIGEMGMEQCAPSSARRVMTSGESNPP